MSLFKKDKSDGNVSEPNSSQNLDVASQLKKIADHLVFLEKKLDTLLGQSGPRKPFGNRPGGSGFSSNRDPRDNYRANRYDGRRHSRPGHHSSGQHSAGPHSPGQHSGSGGNFQRKFTPNPHRSAAPQG